MSMPSIFLVASIAEAKEMRLNHELPAEDVYECRGIENLKLSMLRAILERKKWDVGMMDDFKLMFAKEKEWAWQIPDDFVTTLNSIDEAEITLATKEWASTEEMRCKPADALFVLNGMREVAVNAQKTQRHMFLYLSL